MTRLPQPEPLFRLRTRVQGVSSEVAVAVCTNREPAAAAEALAALADGAVHAVTDVTGFGLLGHAWEMAERSGTRLELDADYLPLYAGALAAAEAGVRTGGDRRNRAHLEGRVDTSAAPPALEALAYDPQTSGGLLASLPSALAGAEADSLGAAGFHPIGRVVDGTPSVRLR